MISIWAILFGAGALQGLIMAAVLWGHRQGNNLANRCLALFLAIFSISLGYFALLSTTFVFRYPHLIFLTLPLPWLYGPFLFGYLRCKKEGKTKLLPRDAWHLVPFALIVLALLPFYGQSGAAKDDFMRHGGIMQNPVLFWGFYAHAAAMALHMGWYAWKSWKLENSTTLHSLVQKNWHRRLLVCFMAYIGLFVAFHIMEMFIGHQAMWLCYLLKFLMAASMYGIGVMSFREPTLFSPALRQVKSTVKYQNSALTPQIAQTLAQQVTQTLTQEKPYLDPDLTLAQLAESLHCTPHALSQVINENLGYSFPELLNSYRVQEAQRRLSDPATAHDIILKVALEVGFNNKASFNSAFKKFTGTTPSVFKKNALQQQPAEVAGA